MLMWEDKLLSILLLVLACSTLTSGLATTKPQLFAHPTYVCALRSTGHVDCWGQGPSGASVAAPTNQQFWAISSGVSFACALGYDGFVQCWGEGAPSYSLPAQSIMVRDQSMCVQTDDLQFDCLGAQIAMNGTQYSFSQVAFRQDLACGLLADTGSPICWRQQAFSQVDSSLVLARIVMGNSWACGVEQGSGALRCLAPGQKAGSLPKDLPPGVFLPGTLVSKGDTFCALNSDHLATCWDKSYPDPAGATAPQTPFVQLAMGEGFVCGLTADGAPVCWANDARLRVPNPPPDMKFVLLAASQGYACGMREDEVTVCWGESAPTNRPCPVACFEGGILDKNECRCHCPAYAGRCSTCPADSCNNGGRVLNDGVCSCECHNTCGTGCVRTADCSCRCAATAPHSNLADVPDNAPESALLYRIAGGESSFPVKRLSGHSIAGAAECSQALLYLRLSDTTAWSGVSCADSGSLFMGANLASLDINKYTMASVRLSGDQDGGWLYRIVKCVPATNTLLLCPRNWLMDSVHCPGLDRDCSKCLPLGRGQATTTDYQSTCTEGPAPVQASHLRSVILAGGYSGHHAEPSGSLWRVALPPGVTCATRFLMFRAREWRADLGAMIVKLHADGNGDYQYVYRGCNGTGSPSLLLQPYQWTIASAFCPHLDCSLCLASSQGYCLPSNTAPYGLEVIANDLNTYLTLSWADPGAPVGTNYAVYLRNADGPAVRYTTTSKRLELSLEGTGLGPYLEARVVRVYCPSTCLAGDCVSNSLYGVQQARSVRKDNEECVGGVADCMGVCNGTALLNPCGICTLPANYYKGEDYWVDCANTCGGLAYISECGVCVDGRSGLPPNAHKDCQGTCFGNATLDDCGVCHAEGSERSSRDCAGMCGGEAVVDECGECVLGTTGREFNGAMDCAGQCFGKRLPTDPACQCAREQLDKCFVCGGDNSTCAGCDGVPNSGLVRDLCGLCGGNSSTCCFLSFAQAVVVLRDFKAMAVRSTLDAGETLQVRNLHAGRDYTVTIERLDKDDDRGAKWPLAFPTLRPGNSLHIEISQPGKYRLTTVESSTMTTHFTVRYNAKTTDACGHCIDSDLLDDSSQAHMTAYEHCCTVMESDNVHAWFATTHYRNNEDAVGPNVTTRVVQRSENYRSSPTRHLLRLMKPQMVDTSVWNPVGQRLEVGDLVVLENRDLLDHVISITGPQPMPDVVLDRGTVAVVGPVLTPGTYRVVSRGNLINTTFTVEFAFACTVHGLEVEQDAAGSSFYSSVVGLALPVGRFTLAILLVACIVVAALSAVRARREE